MFEENEFPQQRFTGYWIPVELTKLGLSKIEQFLLSIIDSLEADAPKYCFASNKYLAQQMNLSESRVSFYITKFKRMGLIQEVGTDGRRRRIRTLKENWYKPDKEVSKKELCAETGNQPFQKKNYARKREGSLRENAIDPYIYKKEDNIESSSRASSFENQPTKIENDDDDDDFSNNFLNDKNLAASSSDVVVTKTNGSVHRMSQSEIYKEFIKHPGIPTDVIQESIERIRSVQGPVNNIVKYLISVCKSIMSEQKTANPKKTETKKPTTCYPSPQPPKETMTMAEYIRRQEEKKKHG